jgi:membrane associated rhomboid family serine protease
MGLADRDYQRRHPDSGGFMSRLTPVVKWLLFANVAVFFIDMFAGHPFREFGAFATESALSEFKLWEFVTFQFIHDSVGHLLFNMIGLYFFGPLIERWWGSRKFVCFYLLCGCAGASFFALLTYLNLLPEIQIPLSVAKNLGIEGRLNSAGMVIVPQGLIGASAGIYGILVGVAVIAPNLRVMLLFPPIELTMRQLAIAAMTISIGAILLRLGGNEGGEAGHLGGAILGFFLVRYPGMLGKGTVPRPPRLQRTYEPKLRPRSDVLRQRDDAVDLILDKISREGFQSLTADEREVLRKASENNNSE